MTVRGTDLASHPPHHPGMDRRRFLLTSLAGAFAAPVVAGAQQAVGRCRESDFCAHAAPQNGEARCTPLGATRRG
jgi:hypothetical protein